MIVLDTNVISELMRRDPARQVVAWLDLHPADQVFLTAVTVAELLYGIARLRAGHRTSLIAARVGELFDDDFGGRVLAFTGDAALWYAEIVASRERLGHPISTADAQIAAVCRPMTPTWPPATSRTSPARVFWYSTPGRRPLCTTKPEREPGLP